MSDPDPSPNEPPGPTLGEHSRRYLRERELPRAPNPHPPAYRVPSLRPRLPAGSTVVNAVLVAHFALGVIWCMLGAAAILGSMNHGVGPDQRAALLGLGVILYGGLCIGLAIGLWIGARWAWPTAIVLAIGWLLILVYQSLMVAQISLALLIPGWLIWALWRHKARFREPH
jgi:hypothetical protein